METSRIPLTRKRYLVHIGLLTSKVIYLLALRADLIRTVNDPEHPLTLEQLAVVSEPQVNVKGNHVLVEFTPTVPHCGASTLIGVLNRTNA